MNNKIIISISVIITIVIIAFSLTQNEMTEKPTSSQFEETNEITEKPTLFELFLNTQPEIIEKPTPSQIEETNDISNMLKKIEEDKILNEKLDKPYYPKERKWITSGPFKIDRSEYVIGEKIFVQIGEFDKNIEGKMIFSKIINKTNGINYYEMPFENSKKPTDFYLSITPSKIKQMCTTDELHGDWKLIFQGTNYESLNFKIKNQVLVGLGPNFDPVC